MANFLADLAADILLAPYGKDHTDLAKPRYMEIMGTIYKDGHVVEDSAEIADAIQQLTEKENSHAV